METLKELFSPGWVGSLLSLAGLVAAIILYRASLVGARPVFQAWSDRIVGPAPAQSGITIAYHGKPIQRLTRTVITFWNSGRGVLRSEDVVRGHPIRVTFRPDTVILDVRVRAVTRAVLGFQSTIVPDAKAIAIDFDYMDPGDGAVMDILHTGGFESPTFHGTVKGVPTGVQDWGLLSRPESSRWGLIGPKTVGLTLFPVSATVWLFAFAWLWRDKHPLFVTLLVLWPGSSVT